MWAVFRAVKLHIASLKSAILEAMVSGIDDSKLRKLECGVCFDSFAAKDGVECTEGSKHFMCNGCFSDYVVACSNEDPGVVSAREGKCPCFFGDGKNKCGTIYDEATIASHVAHYVYDQHLAAKDKMKEASLVKTIKQQLAEEADRLAKKTAMERELHHAKTHIEEEILTTRCPRCKTAFLDFTNCFAVTCSTCKCGFCGWCLADCGSDAHSHVAHCPYVARRSDPRSVHGVAGAASILASGETRNNSKPATEYALRRCCT